MENEIKRIKKNYLLYLIILVSVLLVSVLWNLKNEDDEAIEYALVEAHASFNKDLIYRRWAAMHGGVYVPITDKSQPNPYLKYIDNRDITTTDSVKLTLINPAYMTRQVHEIGNLTFGVKGHITSLNPLRPENMADEWETYALQHIENGEEDYYGIISYNDTNYLRLMHPMYVESSCMKCHAYQGYQIGDIRGGISVSVPMEKYEVIASENKLFLIITHLFILLIFILFGFWTYRKEINHLKQKSLIQGKLLENEERFNLAMNASSDGLFDWNLITNEIYYSPGWKKMLGYTDEELPNDFSVWEKTTHPEDVEKSWQLQNKLINKEVDRFELEFKMKHKKGHWVDILSRAMAVFNDKNEAIRIVGTHVDVTERNQAFDKLLKAETSLKNTFDISPIIISTANLKTGYFTQVSPAVKRILGYSQEQFLSIPIIDLIHPDDWKKTEKEISKQIDGKEIPAFENRYLCADGTYKWMDWKGTPADENGIVTAIGSDISDRKKYEEELLLAKNKAEESDRLKSAFLANMSHEIRTPMNGILGFISLLNNPNLSSEKVHEYSKIIYKSSNRLLNTINDIIDISKIESGQVNIHKKSFNVNEIMNELYEFSKQEAEEKGLELIYIEKPNEESTVISTDEHKVVGILSNLVKNAIKYTIRGNIKFGFNVVDGNIEFFVQDTGIGIPQDRIDAIFNRFEQADISDQEAFEGSGLGLAISKAYVDMLNGNISVESNPDVGSLFKFTIPVDWEMENMNEKSFLDIDEKIENKDDNINILIAEDDDISIQLLKIYLGDIVDEILFAKTGKEAVKVAKDNPQLDLILMDLKMPEMDGYKATKLIREFNKHIIIIAQTAHALAHDREIVISNGFNEYISKPIDKDELFELLKKFYLYRAPK